MMHSLLLAVLVQLPITDVRVHDGDTITVDVPGWPSIVGDDIGVRLLGVDTPELHARAAAVRAWAEEAKQYLATRVAAAKRVELGPPRRDKYFRLLAPLLLDGEDVAADLIRRGYAKPYNGRTKSPWRSTDVPKPQKTKGVL